MSRSLIARLGDRRIRCPMCAGERFSSKQYRVAGSILQALDLEGFGHRGLMLICEACSHIVHFAREDVVTLEEVG